MNKNLLKFVRHTRHMFKFNEILGVVKIYAN